LDIFSNFIFLPNPPLPTPPKIFLVNWIFFKFYFFTQSATAKPPKYFNNKNPFKKKLINEKPFKDMSHYNIINLK
jgi:hypothetical protein